MTPPTTIHETDTLVTHQCPVCFVWHAIPVKMEQKMLGDRGPSGKRAYCPNGHTWHFIGKTDAERAREEAEQARKAAEWQRQMRQEAEEQRDHAQARVRGYQGALAKTKKRIASGACPACHEKFPNVAQHMATEHPGFGESSGA